MVASILSTVKTTEILEDPRCPWLELPCTLAGKKGRQHQVAPEGPCLSAHAPELQM